MSDIFHYFTHPGDSSPSVFLFPLSRPRPVSSLCSPPLQTLFRTYAVSPASGVLSALLRPERYLEPTSSSGPSALRTSLFFSYSSSLPSRYPFQETVQQLQNGLAAVAETSTHPLKAERKELDHVNLKQFADDLNSALAIVNQRDFGRNCSAVFVQIVIWEGADREPYPGINGDIVKPRKSVQSSAMLCRRGSCRLMLASLKGVV